MLSSEYLAGYIDGEGSIDFVYNAQAYRTQIQISSVYPGVLNELGEQYGGGVYARGFERGPHRQSYHWALTGPRAVRLLEEVLPYLREKKPQAELVLALTQKLPGRRGYTPELVDEFESGRVELKRLKRMKY